MYGNYYMINSDELYHHGVLGMRWGVRHDKPGNGRRSSGKGGKAIPMSQRGLLERTADNMRDYDETWRNERRNAWNNAKNAKGIGLKLDYLMGDRRNASMQRAASKHNQHVAENSKTKYFKRSYEVASRNNESWAKYYDKESKKDFGRKIVDMYMGNPDQWNVPLERYSGRKTTSGKEAIDIILTGGMAGVILDAKYKHDQKKNK